MVTVLWESRGRGVYSVREEASQPGAKLGAIGDSNGKGGLQSGRKRASCEMTRYVSLQESEGMGDEPVSGSVDPTSTPFRGPI